MTHHVPPPPWPAPGSPEDAFLKKLLEIVGDMNDAAGRSEKAEANMEKQVRRYLWLVSANTIVFGANMAVMIFYIVLRLRLGGGL